MSQNFQKPKLVLENLEQGDLKRLVHDELHIDQYKSKMGSDEDVCVLSFKVSGKEPSNDLVNFIEKGYDFVLDADVSSGEKEGGDYLVFVELDRTEKLPDQIISIIEDIENLTEIPIDTWRFRYRKSNKEHALSKESLSRIVPLTPEVYVERFEREQDELDAMKTTAGIDVDTRAPDNEMTEGLRRLAGLI